MVGQLPRVIKIKIAGIVVVMLVGVYLRVVTLCLWLAHLCREIVRLQGEHGTMQ